MDPLNKPAICFLLLVPIYKRVQNLVYTFKKLHAWRLPSGLINDQLTIYCNELIFVGHSNERMTLVHSLHVYTCISVLARV